MRTEQVKRKIKYTGALGEFSVKIFFVSFLRHSLSLLKPLIPKIFERIWLLNALIAAARTKSHRTGCRLLLKSE